MILAILVVAIWLLGELSVIPWGSPANGIRLMIAAGFIAAVVNILVLEFLTFVYLIWAWYLIPVLVLPIAALDAVIAYSLTRGRGKVTQVGHGMLVSCLAAVLTLVLAVPAFLLLR